MTKKVNCIMLIDDNPDDNYYHERVIKKYGAADIVITQDSGIDALNYLKAKNQHEHTHPNLILLDINMPEMNGWEFINEYKKLDKELQSKMIIVMLTTSENRDDIAINGNPEILADFKTKPLTKEMLDEILDKYYSEEADT